MLEQQHQPQSGFQIDFEIISSKEAAKQQHNSTVLITISFKLQAKFIITVSLQHASWSDILIYGPDLCVVWMSTQLHTVTIRNQPHIVI